jgi:hypothetical protein
MRLNTGARHSKTMDVNHCEPNSGCGLAPSDADRGKRNREEDAHW